MAAADAREVRARAVRYDHETGRIVLDLVGGSTFIFPAQQLGELSGASASELADVELLPGGIGLHWEKLDADISVPGLLVSLIGTRPLLAEVGRRAKGKTSKAKQAASRENGKKGGRPKKRAV
jgi:hypothetical protein